MAKKKSEEKVFLTSVEDISAYADILGRELDNPPVSMDRGSYVNGALSFGSLILDLLTGGGAPPGKISNVFGPEGSGKSTICGHLIHSCTTDRVPIFYFDHEAAADGKYFSALGAKLRMPDGTQNPYLKYYQPTTAEDTYRTINRILKALPDFTPTRDGGRPKPSILFVIDSIAAMLPAAVDENDEKVRMAAGAAVHSQMLPTIKSRLGRKNASLFATNQTRLNPGQMFGNPEYEPGGQAWKFYPDLKFRISGVKQPFEERNRSMRFVNVSTKKNKQFPPFLECKETMTVAFGRGIDRVRDAKGYLQLTGQWQKHGSRVSLPWAQPLDIDAPWANPENTFYEKDLIPYLATDEFRRVCRSQLESDVAYKAFFKNNDWEELYGDPEAAEDEENLLEALAEELKSAEPPPAPKKTRKKKRVTVSGPDEAPGEKTKKTMV